MAKNTRPLSGQSQKKYFRELFRSDPGVSPEAAQRLTDLCTAEIAQIRIRLPLAVRRPLKSAEGAKPAPAEPDISAASSVTPPFDPHAFSLIVELRQSGKDGLATKLATVLSDDQLRLIAKSQHVALEAGVSERPALIAAIIAGTERRLAHRQAAAS